MTKRLDGRPRADYVCDAERVWFPILDELGVEGLRDHLVERGVRATKAATLAFFVRDHRDLRIDGLNRNTRADYRRDLLEVGEPPRMLTRAIGGYVNSGGLLHFPDWPRVRPGFLRKGARVGISPVSLGQLEQSA